jgi:glutaredoxin
MSNLSYNVVKNAIDSLANNKKSYDCVIIGYNWCPYSKKAKRLCKKNGLKFKFVGYDDKQDVMDLKKKISYVGTLPIVFIKERTNYGCNMIHIGGADNLRIKLVSQLEQRFRDIDSDFDSDSDSDPDLDFDFRF